jgi:transcriptional regulator with XRE-family HTH domain
LKKTTVKTARNLIGPTVRRIRLSQRTAVSQHDLSGRLAAQGLTIDRSAVARIERGERYVLDYEAAGIARAFRVSIQDLFPRKKS